MVKVINLDGVKYVSEADYNKKHGTVTPSKIKIAILQRGWVAIGRYSVDKNGDCHLDNAKIKIAIARCSRISYLNFEGKDDYAADIKLCDRLFGNNPKHLSPTEHVAEALDSSDSFGNFRGFKQYRYFFQDQNLKDPRVIKK